MRTTFTIGADDFASYATEAEATKWTVIDRSFPNGTDSAATRLALVRASFWLDERLANIPEPVPTDIVRCVVRLATYRAAGDFVAVAPEAASVSNGGMTITQRFAGRQDIDEASRLGFPDVETYRLAKPFIARGTGVGSFTIPSVYTERPYL